MKRCIHKVLYNYISKHKLLSPFSPALSQGTPRPSNCSILTICLRSCRQRVVINSQTSEWTYVLAGVPQGSILGPLLFLIYINDMVYEFHVSVRLFADDTSLYIIVENPNTAATILNHDLNRIDKLAAQWLVNFNAAKTISQILSLKRSPLLHPPLYMNGTPITDASSHKHLGLTFNNNCNCAEHINNITTSAWTRLNLLRALKFKINRHALEKIYISFIRPLLEYVTQFGTTPL